jgi:iron complex outermembrane receptor protein
VIARDSNVNFSAVRGSLRWLASDALEFNLSVDYTDDDRNPTGAVLVDANTIANANMQPVPGATNLPLSNFIVPHGSYYNYASFQNPSNPWVGNLPVAGAFDTSYNGQILGVTRDYVLQESRPIPRQFYKGGGTSLTADWKASETLALKSITAWRWYNSGFVNDNDLSPLNSSVGDGELPFHSFSEELRLNGALGSAVDWTLGAFYMRQTSRYESWQDLRYNGQANSYVRDVTGTSTDAKRNPLQFQQNDPVRAKTWAVFGHASWHLTEALTANLGLRYTDEEKSYTFVRQNPDGSPQTFIGALDGQPPSLYSGDQLDYRVNVQYDWTPNFMTYLQYATGFKGGGVSPRPFVIAQAVPFDPETLDTYELGVKSDLFERRLRLNGAVYFGKYRDIQLSLQSCPQYGVGVPCGAWANAGNGEVKGLELEAAWRPVTGLQFDGAYNYFDFEYTSIDPAALPAVPRPWNITIDDTLPFSPKKKWSLGGQYEFPLSAGGTLAARVDYAYQGGFYTNGANQASNRIQSYDLVNARLTWRSSDGLLDVALEGTNLTDKYYFLSRADQLQAAGHTDGAPGRPREWAVTIKKRF